jgi:hypothetical protein
MIGEPDRLMRHRKAALPLPILSLRRDDWVTDFNATLARVLGRARLCARPGAADRRLERAGALESWREAEKIPLNSSRSVDDAQPVRPDERLPP